MDNSDKAMFSASGTPPAESIPKKKKGKKALIIAAAVLAVIAAGLILYDTVGPGFVNCLISFDPAGGEPIESIRVKLGRSAELPDPVRENYTFTGWTLEGSMVGSPYSPEQDVTLTAEWIGNEYTVSFDMDGGLLRKQDAAALLVGFGLLRSGRYQDAADHVGLCSAAQQVFKGLHAAGTARIVPAKDVLGEFFAAGEHGEAA